MKGRVATSAALLLLVLCSPAFADSRDASAEAHDYMREYARCMVAGNDRTALNLVNSTIDASEFERRFPQLVGHDIIAVPRCERLVIPRGIKINFDGEPLRFALAEALVEKHWKAGSLTSFDAVAPLPLIDVEPRAQVETRLASVSGSARRSRLQADYERSVIVAWLFQFGECVVRSDPLASKAWILSAQGSVKETSVRGRMGPALGACLATGEKLSFNSDVLRGTITVSYVRLATAAALAGAK